MNICIKEIEVYLPTQRLTNDQLKEENPTWFNDTLVNRTGVLERRIAGQSETALDLAFEACQRLFQKHQELQSIADCIVFCTQSPDYIIPPNACILHGMLGLGNSVLAFDYNLACSGYIYGLAISRGLVATGMASNVLLVNSDTYTKFINSGDRSTRTLFGDAAAVSWITASEENKGVIDIQCSTSGLNYEMFMIPAGGMRNPKSDSTQKESIDKHGNVKTSENIHMDGVGVLGFVNSVIPNQIESILKSNGLSFDDIDLLIFHQASKLALDSLKRVLRVDSKKIFSNLSLIGNTVSASIPIALKEARDQNALSQGNLILLVGFGVGLSWGTALLRV